jgi:hypothetical protein
VTQNFISVPYPYPPAVFPIFAGILECEMLKHPNQEDCIDWFCEKIREAPLSPAITNEKRFVTYLIVYILSLALKPTFELDDNAVGVFQGRFKPVVDSALNQYMRPLIGKLETHLNRFASTQFELNMLLSDWQRVFNEIRASLGFPAAIKTFVLRHIVTTLDVRAANRLLSNPVRFSFANSMTWLSFLTALETAIGSPFTITSQICQIVQMAAALSADPARSDEICPDLSKSTVLFVLASIVPDEMLATTLDLSPFAAAYEIDPIPDRANIPIPIVGDYMEFVPGIRIADWNAATLSPEFLVRFPFFERFANPR